MTSNEQDLTEVESKESGENNTTEKVDGPVAVSLLHRMEYNEDCIQSNENSSGQSTYTKVVKVLEKEKNDDNRLLNLSSNHNHEESHMKLVKDVKSRENGKFTQFLTEEAGSTPAGLPGLEAVLSSGGSGRTTIESHLPFPLMEGLSNSGDGVNDNGAGIGDESSIALSNNGSGSRIMRSLIHNTLREFEASIEEVSCSILLSY